MFILDGKEISRKKLYRLLLQKNEVVSNAELSTKLQWELKNQNYNIVTRYGYFKAVI